MAFVTDLGRYRIVDRLGSGGMGEVYRAVAVGPDGVEKPVAIKLIRDVHLEKRTYVELFIEEAKVAFLLTHPHVVQTYELGLVDGHYFIAMELVEGSNLGQLLDLCAEELHQPLPHAFALYIAARVARGLAHAHELRDGDGRALNIVHRDISPHNVLVSVDGQVKVTDFGLAKSTLRKVESASGQIKGKVAYMAPEQLEGVAVDQRADIYALGVMLYEMLAGQNPFGPPEQITVISRYEDRTVEPLESVAAVDPQIARIVAGCLAELPDDRYDSARELAREIEACARTLALHASDYELADFVLRARELARAERVRPASQKNPFDDVLGAELQRVGQQDRLTTYVRTPPAAPQSSDAVRAADAASIAAEAQQSTHSSRHARPRRWLALGVVALAAAAGGALWLARAKQSARESGAAAAVRTMRDARPSADSVALSAEPVLPLGDRRAGAAGRSDGRLQPPRDSESPRQRVAALQVLARPKGATVYLDGEPRGTTPLLISGLRSGPRRIEVRARGRRPYRQRIVLEPGARLTLRPKLVLAARRSRRRTSRAGSRTKPAAASRSGHGTLSVNSEPWSIVYIDGARVRATPLIRYRLTAGQHVVKLVNPAVRLTAVRRVTITAGAAQRLSIRLK